MQEEPGLEFVDVFRGFWKRNLTWRLFGGDFKILKASNNIIFIEQITLEKSENNAKYLNWKFGDILDSEKLQFGYLMKVIDDSRMEWQFRGNPCFGSYSKATRVAQLEFRSESSHISITYRLIDRDTIAVNIVEVEENGDVGTIQYGLMHRIYPEDYNLKKSNSVHSLRTNTSAEE
jgi:hypothetical protein